jgi:hypothetical protein
MIRVAIIGASGYTGSESIKILLQHEQAKLTYLTALPEECGAVEEVFPQFKGRCPLRIEPLDLDKLSELGPQLGILVQEFLNSFKEFKCRCSVHFRHHVSVHDGLLEKTVTILTTLVHFTVCSHGLFLQYHRLHGLSGQLCTC